MGLRVALRRATEPRCVSVQLIERDNRLDDPLVRVSRVGTLAGAVRELGSRRMRLKPIVLVLCLCALLSALAAAPAGAAQRIDMRVLLLGAAGWEPSLAAWEAQLRREGVPYDEIVARPGHTPIRAETLSSRA